MLLKMMLLKKPCKTNQLQEQIILILVPFFLKTKYERDKTELETKIPDVTDFVKKTKLTKLESKIQNVSGLATKSQLTAVENKIPDVISLVTKTNYDTKISELEIKLTDHNHDKYITTPEFNTLSADVFNLRLAQQI